MPIEWNDNASGWSIAESGCGEVLAVFKLTDRWFVIAERPDGCLELSRRYDDRDEAKRAAEEIFSRGTR